MTHPPGRSPCPRGRAPLAKRPGRNPPLRRSVATLGARAVCVVRGRDRISVKVVKEGPRRRKRTMARSQRSFRDGVAGTTGRLWWQDIATRLATDGSGCCSRDLTQRLHRQRRRPGSVSRFRLSKGGGGRKSWRRSGCLRGRGVTHAYLGARGVAAQVVESGRRETAHSKVGSAKCRAQAGEGARQC